MANAPMFDFNRLYPADRDIARTMLGLLREPDLVIAPAGHGEYLYRWYVIPRSREANVYFHIQTASDPERPLHDHPWDSTSVILAGGYDEVLDKTPGAFMTRAKPVTTETRKPGDVIFRPAKWAHRLILPAHIPYSMSLFSTGPKVREWGFWEQGIFRPFHEVTVETEGRSTWKQGGME